MGLSLLGARVRIILGGLSGSDAQKLPAITAKCARRINGLSRVVRHMRHRSKQGFLDAEDLTANRNGPGKVCITQSLERIEKRCPSATPVVQQIGALHEARRELVLAIAPRFLTVRGKELGNT